MAMTAAGVALASAAPLLHIAPALADLDAADTAGTADTGDVAGDPVLAQINAYRFIAGAAPARVHTALAQSAQNHIAYYDANRADPSLNGKGLHEAKRDAPVFPGVTMGGRA